MLLSSGARLPGICSSGWFLSRQPREPESIFTMHCALAVYSALPQTGPQSLPRLGSSPVSLLPPTPGATGSPKSCRGSRHSSSTEPV